MSNTIIGFIGLGQMGAPMANNLSVASYQVIGYDINLASDIDIDIDIDITVADSISALAQQADIIITMLPDGAASSAVAEQTLPHMRQDTLLIDCSTIDVATAQLVGAKAINAGIGFLDAPVSGGIAGASAGSLTFMVGGNAADMAKAMPLFDIMGNKAVHCGDIGAGQIAKICNNMILGATMIVTCEAFDLADRLGLDRQKMFDVVSTSSGYSWSMNAYCPAPGIGPNSPADNDYKPGFSADLMLKDLGLALKAAEQAGAHPRIGAHAKQIYDEFVKTTGKGKDFSAILPWLHEAYIRVKK